MSPTSYYWYNLTTQSVQQADERPSDDTIGPFATIEEAEDSPATLVMYAQAWLDSEAFEPYRAAAEEDASTDL